VELDIAQTLRQAVEDSPNDAKGYLNLARYYQFDEKQPLKAAAVLEKAMQQGLDEVALYSDYRELIESGELKAERAIEFLKTATENRPDNLELNLLTAEALLQNKQSEASLPFLNRVRRAAPRSQDLRNRLGLAYLHSSQVEVATAILGGEE
jgi:predicted Zn-dependent protease